MSDVEPASRLPVFREIFDQHWPFVWRILQHFGARSADVEDLGQEVFLIVHNRLADFDTACPIRPWIAGICRNVAMSHKRRAYVRRESLTDTIVEPPASIDHAQFTDSLAMRRLDRLLAELPEEQRIVFLLHQVEQLPMAEVVAMLECPLQTGYSRYNSALQRIQAAFAETSERSVSDG